MTLGLSLNEQWLAAECCGGVHTAQVTQFYLAVAKVEMLRPQRLCCD
ncbi:hypothetical protein GCM10027180_37310 [Microbulbifer echini]